MNTPVARPVRSPLRLVMSVHGYAAILITLFAIPHLANHLTALLGPDVHLVLMERMRQVYRHPVLEMLLLLAVLVQVVTGAWQLYMMRRSSPGPLVKVRRWAGLILGLFLLQHVSAVLFGRLAQQIDTNFYFAAAVLKGPLALYFAPYYFLGVTAFATHLFLAGRPRLTKQVGPRWADRITWTLVALGALAALMIVLTFSGIFYPIQLPPGY